MKILVLTDHSTHGKGESIYDLLKQMSAATEVTSIHVASRNNPENSRFFESFSSTVLFAKQVDDEFSFCESGTWFNSANSVQVAEFDVVFLRLDRPVSNEHLNALKSLFDNQTIVNDPVGIQVTGSKKFLLNFQNLTPRCGLIGSYEEAFTLASKHPIVIKPLEGYGGIGLIYFDNEVAKLGDDPISQADLKAQLEAYAKSGGSFLWMEYLENVSQGDKRVLVVGSEVVGATLRLPAENSWLCNLKQGGTATAADISPEEYEIANQLIPVMMENGVIIFGFDTLVDNTGKRTLSEINTLNVGGLLQAQEFSGKPVISNAAKGILAYMAEKAQA